MNKEQLENLAANAKTEEVREMAKADLQKIELQEKAAEGDPLSRSLLALKETIDTFKKSNTGGGSVNEEEVKKLVASMKTGIKGKVGYGDLDPELQSKLSGQVKTTLTLTTPYSKGVGKELAESQIMRPLFQKMLSDFVARNNVYLFGGAGTGKTYIVEQLAKFLGYDYIEVNCNQFTSPLDLVGGQTIDGYQKGKLEMAWSNIGKNGEEMKGAILCLDELPKLDPNTAGVLNAALAKVKLGTPEDPAYIYNGKGDKVYKKNIFVVATGNTQLNETSVEYEANFKQDLSLQDRFVGSTYRVVADYKSEFENALQDFAFIFLFMTKIREAILERSWAGRAFVSYRILISLRDTYIVSRDVEMQKVANTAIKKPKTLKEGIDSFLDLFSDTQKEYLKDVSDYNNFVNNIIPKKDKLPLSKLNTDAELDEVKVLIDKNQTELNEVNE
jgi:cobaltochelatase CobS